VTYSIVARDVETGELGAAIQSAAFGAGVRTLWIEPGVGAVASQSFSDPSYGPVCLLALRTGATASAALAAAARRDRMSPYRQVGVVSSAGTAAAFTGAACVAEAGHLHRRNVACQANMMASQEVWPAMMEAYLGASGTLADRLVAALEAAQEAGGDWRGQEAGRVVVVKGQASGMPWNDYVCDVRVDNHLEPVAELRRLVERSQALRAAWSPSPAQTPDEASAAAREAGLEESHAAVAGLIVSVMRDDADAAREILRRAVAEDPRYVELARRLPGVADLLGLEPVLPRLEGWSSAPLSRRDAGRAGSRGTRSGPARR
jgi:uncharacterized Ntn-hydrolase superfamily protein